MSRKFSYGKMSTLLLPRILLLFGSLTAANGYMNLYLKKQETYRLLGVEHQLYYVRNGMINQYALSFELPLQSHVNDIYFTWQSLRSGLMFYKMHFNVSNTRAMHPPSLNISESGEVPKKVSGFKISLPCTGKINAEVHVTITITIDILDSSEPNTLVFKRKKVCLKKNSMWVPSRPGGPNKYEFKGFNGSFAADPEEEDGVSDEEDDSVEKGLTRSTHIFYVAVACTCAVIILIALAVAIFFINSQRRTDRYSKKMNCYDSGSSQALTGQSQTFLRPDTPNNISGSAAGSGFRRGVSPSIDLKPTDVNTVLSDVMIDRKRISLGDLLLEGTFGRVYIGTLQGEDENEAGAEEDIFIKTITDQARPDQVQVFLTESILLKGLSHPNLHCLMGASCLQGPDQPLLVYPYMQEGNLKKFLLKCRMADGGGSRQGLNTQQLVYMAVQIIRGVQYLHRKKLIHKDIATRNCIVDADLGVKVTDNALARDLFPGDYNCLGDNENRPVKWMAIEALQQKRFSPSSDVWAFGVTLWEMLTMGQQPYAEVDPFEMTAYLQEGYRIAKPHNCPDELFSLMACCWALSPDERPKFTQLLTYLQNFYMALGRYI